MTLITTILDSLNTVNFTNTEHDWAKILLGYLLKRYTLADFVTEINYQNSLGTKYGYRQASLVAECCRLLNISDSSLETAVKTTLNNFQMFTGKHLPDTHTDSGHSWYFLHRFGIPLSLYGRAKQWSYLTDKWDSNLAWQECKAIHQIAGNKGLLGLDPRDNSYWDWGTRYYDENAESIANLVALYKVNPVTNYGALAYARDYLWPFINATHWSGDHFIYRPAVPNWEVGCGQFYLVISNLRANNGYTLTNWGRIFTDMKARLITLEWSSPQFVVGSNKYYCIIHHNPSNSQRRLEGSLFVWYALHAFWPALDDTSRQHLRNMLDGATPGFELTKTNSTLYDPVTKKWRWKHDEAYNDGATVWGCFLMLLMGIVPQTGKGLAISTYDYSYEGPVFDKNWQFDYQNRKLRIPTHIGTIKFLLGDNPTLVTFAREGVHEITFAADWNSVTNVSFIEPLDLTLEYVEEPSNLIESMHLRTKIRVVNTKGGKFFDQLQTTSQKVALESLLLEATANLGFIPTIYKAVKLIYKKITRARLREGDG